MHSVSRREFHNAASGRAKSQEQDPGSKAFEPAEHTTAIRSYVAAGQSYPEMPMLDSNSAAPTRQAIREMGRFAVTEK